MRYQFNAIQRSCQMIRRKTSKMFFQMSRKNSNPVGVAVHTHHLQNRGSGMEFL